VQPGELSSILERLTKRQIDAAAVQQSNLERQLVAAIDQGVRQPIGELAQSFGRFRQQQGQELSQSLQDSMAAFADKLEQVLGGQVRHAKDLQHQALLALEKAIGAFQAMAAEVGRAGASATASMSSQLDKAIADMAAGQEQMTTTMRAFVDELRRAIVQAQTETGRGVERLVAELGEVVRRTLGSVNAHGRCWSRPSRAARSALCLDRRNHREPRPACPCSDRGHPAGDFGDARGGGRDRQLGRP
jgi:hypothetical protein